MIDYTRIVDDLRSAICSANVEWVDYLRSAAADYAVACEEVNERLRKCGEYLRKGLRSEALQLAEIDPNLLDGVAVLDFPERSQCCQILTHYGIRTPTPLMLDVAADLNEAYAIEQPMATLLARHRLLALAHSPLKLRIAVLRELAKVDGNNPVWQQDLLEFERERLKQFQSEVAEAAKRDNLTLLTALEAEILSQDWQELPPQTLVQWTASLRASLCNKQGRAELEQLVCRLNDVFSAFDLAAGRELRGQWHELVAQFPLQPGDSLRDYVQPALDWLEQEDQREQAEAGYRQAVSSLEFALDRGVGLAELEKAFDTASRYGVELSDFLVARYEKRVATLQQSAARQRKLRVGLIVGSVLAAIIVVATVIYVPMRISRINSHGDRVSRLIEEARYDEAEEYLKNLANESPSMAGNSRLQDLRLRLQGLQKKEADRQNAFSGLAKQFTTALRAMRYEPAMMEQLRKTARSPQERTRLMELESEAKGLIERLQTDRDETYSKQLATLTERVEAIEKGIAQPVGELRRTLAALNSELEAIIDRADGVSHKAKSRSDAVRSRLKSIDSEIARREGQQASEVRITNAVANIEQYRHALELYANEFPGNRTNDFRRVMDEAKLWSMIDGWNTLVSELTQRPLAELSPDDAAKHVQSAVKYIDECKGFPGCQVLQERLPYLKAISQRQDNGQRVEQRLARLYSDPLMSDLWMVAHRDGGRYYGRSEPKVEPGQLIGFKYVHQFDFSEKSIGLRPEDVKAKGVAPQSQIAKELKQLVGDISDKTWDRTFYRLLEKIHNATAIDPILKLNLLQQTFEIGRQGSLVFERTFSDYGTVLKESRVDPFANWLDPADEDAKKQRNLAKETLQKLPTFTIFAKRARAESEIARRALGRDYRWIGWLSRDSKGQWQCSGTKIPNAVGELLIVAFGKANTVEIRPIGDVKAGAAHISSTASDVLVEGRPLYFSPIAE